MLDADWKLLARVHVELAPGHRVRNHGLTGLVLVREDSNGVERVVLAPLASDDD